MGSGIRAALAGLAVMMLTSHQAYAENACLQDAEALAALDYAFGNTIRLTGGGETIEIYFDCDGTFASRSTVTGDRFGRWRVQSGQVCTKTAGAEESCGPVQTGRAVGDRWSQRLGNTQVALEIIEGR